MREERGIENRRGADLDGCALAFPAREAATHIPQPQGLVVAGAQDRVVVDTKD